jgi:hypothetical protein
MLAPIFNHKGIAGGASNGAQNNVKPVGFPVVVRQTAAL